MKKNLLTLLFMLAATTIYAQQTKYIFGYEAKGITITDTLEYKDPSVGTVVKTGVISGFRNSTYNTNHYGLLEMTSKESTAFAGCTIDSIAFCPFITTQTKATIVISNTIGGTPLYQQDVTGVASHEWSKAALKTPFKIEAGQQYYIGYVIKKNSTDYPIGYYYTSNVMAATTIDPILDYVAYENSKGEIKSGLLDTQLYTARRQTGNLMCYASISGAIPENEMSVDIMNLSVGEYVKPGTAQTLTTTITNTGVNTINSYNLTIELDGEKKVSGTQTQAILPLWEKTFSVNIPALSEGLHNIKVTVDNINGGQNNFPGLQAMEKGILVYTDSVAKNILVEHFTLTTDKNGYLGDSILTNYVNSSNTPEKVIRIYHHSGKTTDGFTTPEDEAYVWFYGAQQGGSVWAAANMVDRRDFSAYGAKGYGGKSVTGPVHGTSGIKTDAMMNIAAATANFLTLDASAKLKGRTLTINVKGSTLYDLPSAAQKRLNVVILEDSIVAPQQQTASASVDGFVHNNVFRHAITGTWGEANVISEKAIDKTYTYEIPEGWNLSNLRIVAFVSDYDSTSNVKCAVLNSTEAKVVDEEVSEVKYIYYHNSADAPIFNLSGQRLNTLKRGINIIGGKKIIVK